MKTKCNRPALKKAVEVIRTLVSDSPNTRLPSIRELAEMAGVSKVTISRGIDELKNDGLITTKWGSGIYPSAFVKDSGSSLHFPCSKQNKVEAVLDIFKQDILSGRFRTNRPLPPINQLTVRYNVSYPTMRKVLSVLVDQEILKRSGAKYFFFTNRGSRKRRIAVIALALSPAGIKVVSERERTFYRLLSSAALQHNIDLEIIGYNDYLEIPAFYLPQGRSIEFHLKNSGICGVILSSYHMKDSVGCLRRLLYSDIPVSAWIEDRGIMESVDRYSFYGRKLTYFDSSYSILPGLDAGRYLLNKGHRHIAYISPFHRSPWSRNRLKGLQKAAKAFHPFSEIYPCVRSEYMNDYGFMEQVLENMDTDVTCMMEKITKKIPSGLKNRLQVVSLEMNTLFRDVLLYEYCKPVIVKALSNSSITAWVCANDLIAGLVMDCLDEKGIPRSRQPAIIGFDNSFDSLVRKHSSYEFNTEGEIQDMINHLLYPSSPIYADTSTIRLSGTVIERDSS